MELPFTLKNKRRNTNLKQCVFGFEENPPKKCFSLCFGFDSALKTIDAQIFFWSILLKRNKKVLDCQNSILAVLGG